MRGAVATAVDEFATAEKINRPTAAKLRQAAAKAAAEAFQTIRRLGTGRSRHQERDRFALNWWLGSIPDYWEEPEVSDEFRDLLVHADRLPAPSFDPRR